MGVREVLRNALRPGYGFVMADKARKRLTPSTRRAALEWAISSATPMDLYCSRLNGELWKEAVEWARSVEPACRRIVERSGVDLGGGGAYSLLYFVTRLRTPATVVETGVAAGWSSLAFLSALERNGTGHLYSSDFPYFRLDNPEQYVGILVTNDLRARWTLDLRGDRKALPAILSMAGSIGIFHYDSDKSRAGRQWALRELEPYLCDNSIIIMDDIQDNTFFRDFVQSRKCTYAVFEFQGKFLGLVTNL